MFFLWPWPSFFLLMGIVILLWILVAIKIFYGCTFRDSVQFDKLSIFFYITCASQLLKVTLVDQVKAKHIPHTCAHGMYSSAVHCFSLHHLKVDWK